MNVLRDEIRGYSFNIENLIILEVVEMVAEKVVEFRWSFYGYSDLNYLVGVSSEDVSFEEHIERLMGNGYIYNYLLSKCKLIVMEDEAEEGKIILAKKYIELFQGQ